MSKRTNLVNVTNTYDNTGSINTNLERLNRQFDNTISRDGSSPNAMEADLDMNSNDILNVKDLQVRGDLIVGEDGNINELVEEVRQAHEDVEGWAEEVEEARDETLQARDEIININPVGYEEQEPSELERAQARQNLGLGSASIADRTDLGFRSFDSRQDFVDSEIEGLYDGAVIHAGGLAYVRAEGAGEIADLPDWLPLGDPTPGHFGQPKNTLVTGSPGLVAWADYVARVSKVGYIDGFYRCDVELDFTQGETVPATSITIYGDSSARTVSAIQWQYAGEINKWMMKFNWFGADNNSSDVLLRDFLIRGFYSGQRKLPYNGILGINNHRWTIDNVNILYGGAYPLYLTRAFNSDLFNVRVSSGGWQDLQREDTLKVSCTSGDPVVTVTDGPIGPDDVGRTLLIQRGNAVVGGRDVNTAFTAIISSVDDVAGTITLDKAPSRTIVDTNAHFGRVKASVSGDQMTLDTDCLTSEDVGRFVYLAGAGSRNQTLHTSILSVDSPNTATLAYPAAQAVSDVDYTTSFQIHLGRQPAEFPDTNSLGVNDIEMSHVQIEGHHGGGIYTGYGVNVFGNQIKIHGITHTSGSPKSGPALLLNANNTSLFGLHFEFNPGHPGKGFIVCDGNIWGAVLTGATLDGETENTAIVSVPATDSLWPYLNIADFQSRAVFSQHDWLDAGNAQAEGLVTLSGSVFDPETPGGVISGTHSVPNRMGDRHVWQHEGEIRLSSSRPTSPDQGLAIYGQANILGEVSVDGSGVPSGAILERGSNENGRYIRYADGTQICWYSVGGVNVTSSWNGMYRNAEGVDWTFPKPFSESANVWGTCRGNAIMNVNIPYTGLTTHCNNVRVFSLESESSRYVWLTAIGRWF